MPYIFKKHGNILEFQITGRITTNEMVASWRDAEPVIAKHDKIYVLLELIDFEGWGAEAVWIEWKKNLEHFDNIDRVSFVAPKKWQEWYEQFSTPVSQAKTAYFDPGEFDKAYLWLKGDRP